MHPHSLFITAIVISSTAIGAGFAVITHLRSPFISNQMSQTASAPMKTTALSPSVTVANSLPDSPLFLPPNSTSTPIDAAVPSDSEQLRIQLRQAVRQRNAVLLRSLLQASSVRAALGSLNTSEPLNFENLDASAWMILEQAIDYRCRQQMTQAGQDSSGCQP